MLSGLEHKAIVECFIPDKTQTASLFNRFKNEPFRKFIDVNILKIDLVWVVKSRKKCIENAKRVFIIFKVPKKWKILISYFQTTLKLVM